MQTTINQTIGRTFMPAVSNNSLWTRFITYCKDQEYNRLLWIGIALAVHGGALTPVTVMATLFAGPSLVLFMIAMVAMGIVLVTNLAAMPTKITIPAFALSVVIDTAILISCAFMVLA